MEFEDWLILLGVLAIPLIILDGKWRMAKRSRTFDHSRLPQPADSSTDSIKSADQSNVLHSNASSSPSTRQTASFAAIVMKQPSSLIGPSIQIRGDIVTQEPLVIRGAILGTVLANHHEVIIAITGSVSDSVEARSIIVDGCVTGQLKGVDKVALLSRAQVNGTIITERLSCAAGARMHGTVQ
ncbi:bactofilin family protein [Phytohalomonas tamaricis]|uniref:bactofilin family protein n=1 Tax=Phytohalomonas tamaricis TaxID=2081032 RepID=UPI000D0BD3BE|nr:polymer-forming cytoskeletal protein [Phytohalomonas tamaricis]